MTGKTTNAALWKQFLLQIKGQLQAKHVRLPVTLVIDNHSAHYATSVVDYSGFNVLFTPGYSSFYNSQERIWSITKQALHKHFSRYSQELKAQVALEAEVNQVLDRVKSEYNNKDFFMAARKDLLATLQ